MFNHEMKSKYALQKNIAINMKRGHINFFHKCM
ncbi:hypothetical protein [Plasmodium yoelii yoelii]|uniref:Uncharacterized protein n=1 Tax=Plasmodium yoelii yoelii TaxID=73239 RepID=Q7R825_PLAYO|nr:hypothetical protein [Plasmodium yoelii yoelii]